MRKILVTILACMICTAVNAKVEKVNLTVDTHGTKGTGKPTEIPIVNHEDSTVTISYSTILPNVMIVIKDEQGRIVSTKNVNLSPMSYEVQLPEYAEDKQFKVEISYNDKKLYGNINEND